MNCVCLQYYIDQTYNNNPANCNGVIATYNGILEGYANLSAANCGINLHGCALPTISTTFYSATQNSASVGGSITFNAGYTVSAQGVCYSTTPYPTKNNNVVLGTIVNLTGLTPNTTYYARAYATTNSVGTYYGNQVSFTTSASTLSTVVTSNPTSISSSSATIGGNVTSDGGSPVSSKFVCYSLSSSMTSASCSPPSSGTGSFTANITGLSASTTYYTKAQATNGIGTAYGSVVSFTTAAACGMTCATFQTNIDQTYNNNPANCAGVTATYRGILQGFPCLSNCNINTHGCPK